MPASAETTEPRDSGQTVAVWAHALYLLNLLLLPGLAFVLLLVLLARQSATTTALGRCHLRLALIASLWAGALLVLVSVAILLMGGLSNPYTWMVLILYGTTCHSTLVLLGVIALSKALSGQHFHGDGWGRCRG